jgi:Mce-associated membrane protein
MTDKKNGTENTEPADESNLEATSSAVELTEASEAVEGDHTDDEAGATDETDAESTPEAWSPAPTGGGIRSYIGVIAVAILLVVSGGLFASVYFLQYKPDQVSESAAANVALEAAKNGTVALLSYSPDSLDKDFANAKSNLTGEFLDYYTQFTEQIVTPAAKEKQVKTTASVVRAAVSEFHSDSANVLVFINQVTMSKENPDGAFAASSVKVGLKKLDGRWLIDAFDPV